MQQTPLVPHARLPRAHHHRHVRTSTVDAAGTAHWLLAEQAPQRGREHPPYDALVVSVRPDGGAEVTELRSVRARWPLLDRLPEGGFVVAAARTGRHDEARQVQVFDRLGHESRAFGIGDAIEHLLVDEAGHLWAGHFDENPLGIRRWSPTGELVWTSAGAGIPGLFDCYALNVSGTTAWACPYTDFPVVEIRPDRAARGEPPVRVWSNRIRSATALAVHGDRVVLFGGSGEHQDRLAHGVLTGTAVRRTGVGTLTGPDGSALTRRRVVSRGSRIYVQPEPFTEWGVFDLAG
ncbi:hypothetical protein ACIRBX_03235 [Kitasatospora sp. NPDC096147]|uniref:hypothetical protein n=1 Tax=Kitasatospora sp. NPDC096147 TaxID=3364093 RepID=UPI0037F2AFE7